MYKREVKVNGKKYFYYYHNVKKNGVTKNIFLGSNLKEAKKKLHEINKKTFSFDFLKFIKNYNKKVLILFIIFLACLAYGFYSGEITITGFATISAEIEQTATSYANITFNGTEHFDKFGFAMTSGDINGDGYADIIVGADLADTPIGDDTGQVFVFFGADYSTTIDENAFSYANLTFNNTIGSYVTTGNINNDSYDDLIIGTGSTQSFVIFGADYILPVNEIIATYANLTFNLAGFPALGFSVASGDINNDNYTDAIIGSPNSADGQVFVFFGADYTTIINESASSYANLTFNAATYDEDFGYSVASGDINNDSFSDVIVGVRGADPLGDSSSGGQVCILFGADYTALVNETGLSYANITINGTSDDGSDKWLGSSVASGDINNDTYDDIIIGSEYGDPSGISNNGQVFVFFGANYVDMSNQVSYDSLPNANITINGTSDGGSGLLGTEKSLTSGDINGDNYYDIIAAAPMNSIGDGSTLGGRVFIFFGADYTSTVNQEDFLLSNITINGTDGIDRDDNPGSELGSSVTVGDIDNDGYAELIAGAPYANTSGADCAGQVYVFDFYEPINQSTNQTTINGTSTSQELGWSVASGDINNDGLADMIIGDYLADVPGRADAGQVFVFFGDPNGIQDTDVIHANITINGTNNEAGYFGYSVSSGDVNKDGYEDVIAGASMVDVAQSKVNAGQVLVFFGEGYTEAVNEEALSFANITLNGTVASDYFGSSVAAGDVNNDSFADIVVGAYYVCASTNNYEGQAYVFFGAEYDDQASYSLDALSSANMTFNGTTLNDRFGWSVASGDVNNDNYTDIIVGAELADPSDASAAGQVYVFFGDYYTESIGQNALHANLTINGTAGSDYFGWSVSSGDVNNDGYADVIGGAYAADPPSASNTGQAYVFFGADFTEIIHPVQNASEYANITINGTSGQLGYSVSNGDVNNDNFTDIIIGDNWADPLGFSAAGQVYVFFGAGYTEPVSLTLVNADVTFNGTKASDEFGTSVASGDVDNNGFTDVIVGARLADPPGLTNVGQAFVFYTFDTFAPVVALNSPTNSYTETVNESVTFNYTAADTLLDTCELWGNWSDGWHLNESFVNPTSGETNGSSNITLENGDYLWSVYCNDTLGYYNNLVGNYTLTINIVTNTEPTWSVIDDIEKDEDFDNFTIDLNDNITDAEDADLDLEVSYDVNNSDFIVTIDNTTNVMTVGYFTANASGSANISLTVIDTGGLTAFESFDLIVNSVNDAPWWNETANATYSYDEDFGTDFTIWDEDGLNNTYFDVEDSNIPKNCTVETNDTNIVTNVRWNGSIIADSVANAFGNFILTVNCSDSDWLSALTSFEINITDVAEPSAPPSDYRSGTSRPAPAPAPVPAPAPTPAPIPVTPIPHAPAPVPVVPPPAPVAMPPLEVWKEALNIKAEEAETLGTLYNMVSPPAPTTYTSVDVSSKSFGSVGKRWDITGKTEKEKEEKATVYAVIEQHKPKFVLKLDSEEECTEDCAWCFNGIKDYDETGVDCGGSCRPCTGEKPIENWKLTCGNNICDAGEECLCNTDCTKLTCLKLTYNKGNAIGWAVYFIFSILAGIIMFVPHLVLKVTTGQTYINMESLNRISELNDVLKIFYQHLKENELKKAFHTSKLALMNYKKLSRKEKMLFHLKMIKPLNDIIKPLNIKK